MAISSRALLNGLTFIGFFPCAIVAWTQLKDATVWCSFLASVAVSIFGFYITKAVIPKVKGKFLKANLFGMDINKKGTEAGEKKIPESLGLISGVVFLVCIVLFQQLHHLDIPSLLDYIRSGGSFEAVMPVPAEAWDVNFNAALCTICFMLFLGFADDVLDIPWRVKLILPALASLPLLVAYKGGTGVMVPKLLRTVLSLPGYVELSYLYYVYMMMLGIFCTNAINILAGVNGLEVGQTFIIACAVICHNLMELGKDSETPGKRDNHLFSLYIMMPLASTSLALLTFNWYPSQVFVGDTFTYFAGMTFAVAGILGHQGETMLLFFTPQVFNFLYSCPQLFKIVFCPRHRLPTFDPKTGLLTATPNWNLVNLTLQIFGSCSEQALCIRILAMQVVACCGTFIVRHFVEGAYK